MNLSIDDARTLLEKNGQSHVLRYWDTLDEQGRTTLLNQVATIDFALMNRLVDKWILNEPPQETFTSIDPVPVIPKPEPSRPDAKEAWEAGEEALRSGRVGILVVAGGQGTRLGYDGPKGAYPIGPITGKSLFQYHAEKILNLQARYDCTLPWYIMVSHTNEAATRAFFEEHSFFGLNPENVVFFKQRMVPCVDEQGKFMLDAPHKLAMNPNGHGGTIPAIVENGIAEDARRRGIDTLTYFQIDNWAVKVADPYFIGYHVLHNAEMSSKNHRKNTPREPVGVHCLCDGEYRVIEYTVLDFYPQLLETDADGNVIYYAGNPAIHILSIDFIERVFANYDSFPWWRAHKKIPCLDEQGNLVKPESPNGYKFETFIFDALRMINHPPVALEMGRPGEYTPIKLYEGSNSVVAARASMREWWGKWLEAAGYDLPRDESGQVAIDIEVSPRFALYEDEFVRRAKGHDWDTSKAFAIGPDGGQESAQT